MFTAVCLLSAFCLNCQHISGVSSVSISYCFLVAMGFIPGIGAEVLERGEQRDLNLNQDHDHDMILM